MKKIIVFSILLVCLLSIGMMSSVLATKGDEIALTVDGVIPEDAITDKDPQIDDMQKKQGVYFRKVSDEETNLGASQAIALATESIDTIAKGAEDVSAEFVLYTNLARGIDERPVWKVVFEGIGVQRRGKESEDKVEALPLPVNVQTQVYLDALTGDVISLISIGYDE